MNHSEKTIGPIIGSLIIVIILILGGLYFWGQKLNSDAKLKSGEATTTTAANKNDNIKTIKADLDATNVGSLDASVKTVK